MAANLRYTWYVLASAGAAAGGLVLTEIALNFYTATTLEIAVWSNFIGGGFLLTPILMRREKPWRGWPVSDWVRFAVSAVGIYAVGFVFLYSAIGLIGAGKASILGRVEAIFVVVLAVFFLKEHWTTRHWLATLLALAGAILINFDPEVLQLSAGWGEVLTLLAAFVVSAGIVLVKPLLVRRDAEFVTGFGLVIGGTCMVPFLYDEEVSNTVSFGAPMFLLILVTRGMLLGISWAAYNTAMRHIGASRCAVLFLSVSFLTVGVQVAVDATAPGLGLRVPGNLLAAVAGGVIITFGVALIQRE